MKKEINKRHLNKSIFLIKARRVDLYFCACINKRKLSGEDDRNENQPLPGSSLTFEDTVYTPTSKASGIARDLTHRDAHSFCAHCSLRVAVFARAWLYIYYMYTMWVVCLRTRVLLTMELWLNALRYSFRAAFFLFFRGLQQTKESHPCTGTKLLFEERAPI